MNRYKFQGQLPIVTTKGEVIAKTFTRIEHGGRGAYVEFKEINMKKTHIPSGQEWRKDPYYFAYFIEYRTFEGIKIYFQRRRVKYADYQIGLYYISPIFLKDFKVIGEY